MNYILFVFVEGIIVDKEHFGLYIVCVSKKNYNIVQLKQDSGGLTIACVSTRMLGIKQ